MPDTDVPPALPVTVKLVVRFVPPDWLYPVEQVMFARGALPLGVVVVHVPFVALHVGVVHAA